MGLSGSRPSQGRGLTTTLTQKATALQVEATALAMTTQAAAEYRFMQEALATAAAHNLTLTPQQIEQLEQLAARYGDLTASIEKTRTSQEKMKELQSQLGSLAQSSIMGLVDGTKSWNDVLADTLKLMADLLLKAALLGDGPLGSGGGLIGALMGGFSGGGTVKAAGGGAIRGPGSGTSDSIPAMLSNGEFVVRASQAKKFAPLLEAINAGRIPRFAAGGMVGGGQPGRLGGNVSISAPITFNGGGPDGMKREDVVATVRGAIQQALDIYDRGRARQTAVDAVSQMRARTTLSRLR